jgi:hypothetical protein
LAQTCHVASPVWKDLLSRPNSKTTAYKYLRKISTSTLCVLLFLGGYKQ